MNDPPPSQGPSSTGLPGAAADRHPAPGKGRRLLALLVLLPAGSFLAGPYALDWWTVDAGAGTSGGGSYALSGTIGQADGTVMSGGSYRVEGGFWPGLTVTSPTADPRLIIERIEDHVRISWSPDTPGFTLEQTGDLSAPNWLPAPAGNPVTVPISAKSQFFRLRKP